MAEINYFSKFYTASTREIWLKHNISPANAGTSPTPCVFCGSFAETPWNNNGAFCYACGRKKLCLVCGKCLSPFKDDDICEECSRGMVNIKKIPEISEKIDSLINTMIFFFLKNIDQESAVIIRLGEKMKGVLESNDYLMDVIKSHKIELGGKGRFFTEKTCRNVMESHFNACFKKARPDWLVNDRGNKMELDGYNEKLKIAFEYNGKQHYEQVYVFQKTYDDFERRVLDDMLKEKLCKKNGVTLIVIPYYVVGKTLVRWIEAKYPDLEKSKRNT